VIPDRECLRPQRVRTSVEQRQDGLLTVFSYATDGDAAVDGPNGPEVRTRKVWWLDLWLLVESEEQVGRVTHDEYGILRNAKYHTILHQ